MVRQMEELGKTSDKTSRFRKEVLKRSLSRIWELARTEWSDLKVLIIGQGAPKNRLIYDAEDKEPFEHDISFCEIMCDLSLLNKIDKVSIYKHKLSEYNPGRCICGHEIINECLIENRTTQKRILIGNCCIEHINNVELNNKTSKAKAHIITSIKDMNKGMVSIKNIENYDYSKALKKPSGKVLEHCMNERILTLDEVEFVHTLPRIFKSRNGKKVFAISLKTIEKLLDIKVKVVNNIYKAPQYDKFRQDLVLENAIFDNNDYDVKVQYIKKYKLGENPCTDNDVYYQLIDVQNRTGAYILDKNGGLGCFTLDWDSIRYKRGFIFHKWEQTKAFQQCVSCPRAFYRKMNETWRVRCMKCFKTLCASRRGQTLSSSVCQQKCRYDVKNSDGGCSDGGCSDGGSSDGGSSDDEPTRPYGTYNDKPFGYYKCTGPCNKTFSYNKFMCTAIGTIVCAKCDGLKT
jgi:hypothetical protein